MGRSPSVALNDVDPSVQVKSAAPSLNPQAASPSISAKPFERSANPQVDGWRLHNLESAAQSQRIASEFHVEACCEGRRN